MRLEFSAAAERDLAEIGSYTLNTWGEAQAERYLSAIQDCCEQLAANPMLGRACDEIRPGLRRIHEGKHVVFYRIRDGGIFVSRILHESMQPESRSMPGGA